MQGNSLTAFFRHVLLWGVMPGTNLAMSKLNNIMALVLF